MNAWAKAAGATADKTKEFVDEQVLEGEESVARAREVLGVLQGRREAFGNMRGDL